MTQIRQKKEAYADFQDLNPVTEKIIGCALIVSNTLGSGFLEKVYENALALEIQKAGLIVLQQHPIQVWYDGVVVGEYFADLLVQDRVIVEIKAVKSFDEAHWRNVSIISRQQVCACACCSTSASHAWRSNALSYRSKV